MKKLLTIILSLTVVFAFAQQRVENNKPYPNPSHAGTISVTGVDGTLLTVTDLVENLVGVGISFSNVSFTGAQGGTATASGGTFVNGGVIGINQGVLLCSGRVNNAPGPNIADNTGVNLGLPGDADLSAAFGGITTFDATVLEFDFVPTADEMFVQYVFASDEYNEWVGQYNDAFAFFLNGSNIATVPTSAGVPVSVGSVNLTSYPANYNDNDFGDFGGVCPFDIEADGFTTVFTATGDVLPNQTNHIKLVVADRNDHIYDTWVFLKEASFSTTNPEVPVSNWAIFIGLFLIVTFAVIRFRKLV